MLNAKKFHTLNLVWICAASGMVRLANYITILYPLRVSVKTLLSLLLKITDQLEMTKVMSMNHSENNSVVKTIPVREKYLKKKSKKKKISF